MKKRIISLLLCAAMCFIMFPVSILADDDDAAVISAFSVTNIQDGAGNFDTASNISGLLDPVTGGTQTVNSQGNDANDHNGRVRTFDSIKYDMNYQTAMRGGSGTLDTACLRYRFVLPYTSEQAIWLTASMGWIGTKDVDYTLTTETIGGVSCQVLSGRRILHGANAGNVAVPGSGTLDAHVKVLNMKNGDTVQPIFTVWMEGNGPDDYKNATPSSVTVTASPKYNVRLAAGSTAYHSVKGIFDFNTGLSTALDYGRGAVEGRMCAFGVTLQLYNDRANKKMMGIELPEGPISVDIKLGTKFGNDKNTATDVTADYAPLVWAAGANNRSNLTGANGRDLSANGNNKNYLYNGAPANKIYDGYIQNCCCYQGGNWNAVKNGNTITLTVSDYEIDMDHFPSVDMNVASPTNTFNLTDPADPSTVQNIGCFSAGYVFAVIPFYNQNTNEYCLDDFNVPSGDFWLSVSDVNMRARGGTTNVVSSVNGAGNQMKTNDDQYVWVVNLRKNGSLQTYIYYSDTDPAHYYGNYDVNGTANYQKDGRDYAVEGQEISVHWQTINAENGDRVNRGYAYKTLMKFDPAALELIGDGSPTWHNTRNITNPENYVFHGLKLRYLYATKPDGTAWISDAEMNSARIEDLRYYDSPDDIPSGHVCVGVIYELDPVNGVSYTDIDLTDYQGYHKILFKVREGAARNEPYMICIEGRVWRFEDYATAGDVPSVEGLNGVSLPTASGTIKRNYTKAVYDESGFAGGHTGGFNDGDSLLVTKYRVGVSKYVEQKDASGNAKSIFDMDNGQRTVDYIIYPSTYSGLPEPLADVYANVVTITDTLPASLTYLEGSAYVGGDYVPNADPSMHGSISEGTNIEPVITLKDGKQVLTWTFNNVPVDVAMQPIHFSASIGTPGIEATDVRNGDIIDNEVYIRADGDHSVLSESDGNLSKASFMVSKLNSASFYKRADTPYIEADETSMQFTVGASNNGNNPAIELLLDTLPYSGDTLGSSFSGSLMVSSLIIANPSTKTGWTVYYTTSADIRGYKACDISAADLINGSSTIDGKTIPWFPLNFNTTTGAVTGFGTDAPTAIVFTGILAASENINAALTLTAPDDAPGDVFINQLSSGESTTSARVLVISRAIEGVIWNDANKNGERNNGEELLSGVKVTLMKWNGSAYVPVMYDSMPVTCTVGKVKNVFTGEETDGEEGHYRFFGLESGTYAIRIESGSYNISHDRVTGFRVTNVMEQINNDAIGNYDSETDLLLNADITENVMPTKAELVNLKQGRYVSYQNDAGLFHTGSITVLNATIAQYYTAYMVFGMDVNGDYTYTSKDPENDSFLDALTDEGDGGRFFTIIPTDEPNVFKVIPKGEAEAKDIIDFFNDHYRDIKDNVDEVKPSGVIADEHLVRFDNLEYGYYYVYSSLGTVVTLNDVSGDVKVIDKNEGPSWDNNVDDPDDPNMPDPSVDPHNPGDAPGPGPGKVILEYPLTDGEPDYTKTPTRVTENSVNFGDCVKFSIALNATAYVRDELVTYYYITDKIADGFTYVVDTDHPIVVTVTEQVRDNTDSGFGTYHDAAKYTITPGAYEEATDFAGKTAYIMDASHGAFGADEDREFVIAVPFGTQYGVRAKIEVTYFARINTDGTNVVLGADGNLNTADFFWQLDQSFDPDEPAYTSHAPDTTKGYPMPDDDVIPDPNSDTNNPKQTKTYVFGLLIFKHGVIEEEDQPLSGAKFRLLDSNGAALPISGSDGHYIYDKNSENYEAESCGDGMIYIEGVKEGSYSLEETEAPAGFNKLKDPETVVFERKVSKTGYAAQTGKGYDSYLAVENKSGTELPETGGIGTKIFIGLGILLILSSGIFLITNKRIKKASKENGGAL